MDPIRATVTSEVGIWGGQGRRARSGGGGGRWVVWVSRASSSILDFQTAVRQFEDLLDARQLSPLTMSFFLNV